MSYNKQSRLALWAVGALAASVGSAAAQSYGTTSTGTATVNGQTATVQVVQSDTVSGTISTGTVGTTRTAVLGSAADTGTGTSTTATLTATPRVDTGGTVTNPTKVVTASKTVVIQTNSGGTTLPSAADGGVVEYNFNAPVTGSGSLTVSSNAILSGSGAIGVATNVERSGVYNPGNSPGSRTHTASLTIAGTQIAEIDGTTASSATVFGASTYDTVVMSGSGVVLNISSATLAPVTRGISSPATNAFTPPIGSKFVIVRAENGATISGTYAGITQPTSGIPTGSMFSAIYNPTSSIALYVTPANLASVPGQTLTANQKAVAGALQNLRSSYESSSSSDNRTFLDGLYTQTTTGLPVAYDQLSGRDIANIGAASMSTANLVSDTLTTRANNPRMTAQTGLQSTGLAGGDAANGRGWAAWVAPVGQVGSADGDAEAPGYTRGSAGALLGLEGQFNNAVLGLSWGYVRDWLDFKANSNTATVDNYVLSGYGAYTAGPWFLNGSLGYTWKSVESKRNIALGSYSGTAAGKTDGSNFSAGGEVGYTFALNDGLVVEPSFGLRYNSFTLDGFTESGASPVNLVFSGHTVDSLQSSLGVRLAKSIKLDSGVVVVPEARAAWQHELLDERSSVTTRFVNGGGNFTIVGSNGDTDFGVIGLGIKAQLPSKFDLSAGYTTRFSANQMDHGFMAGVKYRF